MMTHRILTIPTMILAVALTVIAVPSFGATQLAPQNVTLAWNPSTSSNIAGYRMYFGGASQNYTNIIDAGNNTSVTASNLVGGATYFFAVTAYNTIGLESAFSSEISYTVPNSAKLKITSPHKKAVLLSGNAPGGYQYDVLRAVNLSGSWTRIGSITISNNGTFQFSDVALTNDAPQYYRLRQTYP